MSIDRVNLLGLNERALQTFLESLGEKPFRAKQLMRWIHHRGVDSFDAMTNVAKSLKQRLNELAEIKGPSIIRDHLSADGTRKWLIDVGQGNAVETVFIPEENRGTLCVSTQAGCAVDCRFCSTGKQGFNRNLSVAEIIDQLWWAERTVKQSLGIAADGPRVITNVVFMGMGEPLLNYDAVTAAISLMLDDNAYGLSRRRVTVSTSGVVPFIDRLGQDAPVALAVSLHASNDALRNELVPLNKKYPLAELMDACNRYLPHAPRDFITFEYVMLDGVNDSLAHAKELVQLQASSGVSCKFNLIPFNSFPGSELRATPMLRIKQFGQVLIDAGIVTTIRKTRGDDIDAACGQLAGEVQDRTQLARRRQPIQWLQPAARPAQRADPQ